VRLDESREGVVDCTRLLLQHANCNVDFRGTQTRDSAPANQRIGIDGRDDYAPHSCCNQRVGAWAGAAAMTARLQCDVRSRCGEIGAAFARLPERNNLRVVALIVEMRALADDLVADLARAHHDAAHLRIGRRKAFRCARKL
jgi:hypothetical protein